MSGFQRTRLPVRVTPFRGYSRQMFTLGSRQLLDTLSLVHRGRLTHYGWLVAARWAATTSHHSAAPCVGLLVPPVDAPPFELAPAQRVPGGVLRQVALHIPVVLRLTGHFAQVLVHRPQQARDAHAGVGVAAVG